MVGSSPPCVLAVYTPPCLSRHPPLNTESAPTSTLAGREEGEGGRGGRKGREEGEGGRGGRKGREEGEGRRGGRKGREEGEGGRGGRKGKKREREKGFF